MAIEKILMPKLGESVTEGIITKWLVKKGDYVEKYEPIAEIASDKVTAEIPSSIAGTIQEIIALEDVAYPCESVICKILITDGVTITKEVIETKEQSIEELIDLTGRYSPAVKWLAKEHHIDLANITGTGIHGRITRKDVLTYIQEPKESMLIPSKEPINTPTKEIIIPTTLPKEVIQPPNTVATGEKVLFTPVRKQIANAMLKSKTEIPHAWMVQQANVTNLVNYRNSIKDQVTSLHGIKLTFFPFFIYAVARVLEKYPLLNSSTDGQSVITHSHIHLGVAVAHEKDLFVPVIKEANKKSVLTIAKELNDFVQKAKKKSFRIDDLTGATFTINNTGSFGSVLSYGIIPSPNVAILQVEKIIKQPVVVNDMLAFYDMVNLCLSLDHRLLDGLICGQFLQEVCKQVEHEVQNFTL